MKKRKLPAMEEILKIMTGGLAANLLTVMFVFGGYKARNFKDPDIPPYTILLSIALPLIVTALGVLAYR